MRADAVAKRREILDAAWRLVSDQGVDVPLRAVAQEAGVGIATLYRHFPTRRDLILGLFSEVRDRVADVIDRHRDGWDDDPTATWHSVVHDLAALHTGALATQMMPVAMVDEGLMASATPVRDDLQARLATLLGHARTHGFVAADVTPVRFHLGLAALTRPLPATAERLAPGQAEWLVGVYIRGLR
ncbi:TetR/AcrR family transcriptional regulator [Corynebacterium bovis]|uniref:TetR/AcrR family transcriptional regulator n=3 Tax=Corynebacterium bovis TaxID=36808 RepID=A0A426Q0Z8_9CORY|nr:TetR/AcrR family transcriptional regulator [Corynebacterium bovis]RRO87417.1 TetR/AcrR family transcriptional regulator [Corynebacterium bovis]RRO90537.1 TetR/AcrR family transcriptional regulator [Corynebacterium bovis]